VTATRIALGLALAALSACGRGAERRPAVIDLLALATTAEREPPEGPRGSQLLALESDDDRDGFAPLRCSGGSSITFRGLRTHGAAKVAFGCGSLKRELPEGTAAEFCVQAWREPGVAGAPPDAEWRQKLRAASLIPSGRRFELALPGDDDARWMLRFSVVGSEADWQAFLSPRVLHEGGDDLGPLALEDVLMDLDAHLGEATILQQSERLPVQRSYLDAAANLGTAGGRRSVIRAAAPARVHWSLTPPAGSSLRFSVGVDTVTGWKEGGDGLTFAVEIDGERIWQLALDPHQHARDRGWKPVSLDLQRWAGKPVALELVTEPGATADFDVGGFASPAIVERHATPRRRKGEAPNVIVVLVDTLRQDKLGFDGSTAGLSPRLDALASGALVFRGAHATASWTWPSTASLLTGLYPNAHGVLDNTRCLLVEALSTMAEQFEAAGYTTGGFSANHLVDVDNRFDQGFETFVCEPNATGRALAQRALDWVDSTPGVARMMYVHLFDPHMPYDAPEGFAVTWPADLPRTVEELGTRVDDPEVQRMIVEAMQAGYDAEVRYADTAVGDLIDGLRARGELSDAVLVFTADHGEEFREHGLLAHGPHLYEETVAVPLLFAGFGRHALPAGVRKEPVSLIDVLPTLVSVAGLPEPPYPLPGHSLLAPPVAETLFAQTMIGSEPGIDGVCEKLSITEEGWKLVRTDATSRFELYDLAADPRELHDLAAEQPERREALAKKLEQWRSMTAARSPDNLVAPDAEVMQRLHELGYFGGK
jgi:arylsulfatase A-like enzyme